MTPVRLGLVGIGGFGASHLRCLQRLRPERLFELVAVADPALHRHAETAAALRQQGVACFSDYQDMLSIGPDLEAVILCTPIPLHKEMAAAALRQGLHVYLEKPPVILSSDLQELIQLDTHRRTSVGFIAVSNPSIRKAHSLIAHGEIGELRSIRIAASWPRPSWYYDRSSWAGKLVIGSEPVFDGPATNALSHYVHLASYLACGDADGHENLSWLEAELYRARPIEAYDTCSLQGEFANGMEFTIALTHACRHRTDVEVRFVGSKRTAGLSIGKSSVRSDLFEDVGDSTGALDTNLRNFAEGIRGSSRFYTTLEDCVPFLDVVAGMWISSGGIHSIDPAQISTWNEEPNTLFHVSDVETAIARSLEGLKFSDQGYPWAVKPARTFVGQLAALDLQAALLASTDHTHQTALAELP